MRCWRQKRNNSKQRRRVTNSRNPFQLDERKNNEFYSYVAVAVSPSPVAGCNKKKTVTNVANDAFFIVPMQTKLAFQRFLKCFLLMWTKQVWIYEECAMRASIWKTLKSFLRSWFHCQTISSGSLNSMHSGTGGLQTFQSIQTNSISKELLFNGCYLLQIVE